MAEPWDVTDKMVAYLIERADALAAHVRQPAEEDRYSEVGQLEVQQ